jgi:predicted enzyme related to lactoylglutathione lyase
MSEQPSMQPGSIPHIDLTVNDAEGVREFYNKLVGWEATPHNMGEYDDYEMVRGGTDQPVAGVCQARGVNKDVPAVWMIYIVVENIEATVMKCQELGGKVLIPPRPETGHTTAFLQDPAGAVFAVYQQPQ